MMSAVVRLRRASMLATCGGGHYRRVSQHGGGGPALPFHGAHRPSLVHAWAPQGVPHHRFRQAGNVGHPRAGA